MVKPATQRNKILLTFQAGPPTSTAGKVSSGTKVSLIPRRNRSFVAREPVSPKVSCLGQIKSTKKKNRSVRKSKRQASPYLKFAEQIKTKVLLEGRKRDHGHTSDGHGPVVDGIAAPSLQQMRHFDNVRGTLSDFDWRAYEEKGVKRKRI